MRLKSILFVLLGVAALAGCNKEEFDILKNPVIIEGEADPVWGFPAARWDVSVTELVGLVDSIGQVDLYTDENDMLALRYKDSVHTVLDYTGSTDDGAKDNDDSIRVHGIISGSVDMPVFRNLETLGAEDFRLKGLFVSAETYVKGYYDDTVPQNTNHGIRIYFDSLTINISCKDGSVFSIPLYDKHWTIPERELMNGRMIRIMSRYNATNILPHKPLNILYSVRMVTVIPKGVGFGDEVIEFMQSIGVDSVTVDTRCWTESPLQMYCHNVRHEDTVEWQMPQSFSDSVLDEVERYMTLDSTSCLVIEAKNYLPLSLKLNLALLGQDTYPLTDFLLQGNDVIAGAPLRQLPDHDSYASNGYAKSTLAIPIDNELLQQLRQTHFVHFFLEMNTTTHTTSERQPTVAIFGSDHVDIRAKVVLAPHVHFSSDPIDIKFNK